MSIIVQKFGGSSVANKDCLFNVAKIIKKYFLQGNKLVVVVSAQGNTTDELLEMSKDINPLPSAREMDVLLSAGEQISISLLSMSLQKLEVDSISLTGWQAGIQTCDCYGNARITNVFNERILKELNKNKVVIVAGFQGINSNEDITTMGRGGSDTTAVAIASSLNAKECQIYTDVNGVYTSDPQLVINAKRIKEISYDNMINLADMGAQILNKRSVELAKKYNVEISVISSMKGKNAFVGTKVMEVDNNKNPVSSVTINENLFLIKIKTSEVFKISDKIKMFPIFESFVFEGYSIIIMNLDYMESLKNIIKNEKNITLDDDISQISVISSNRESNFLNFSKIFKIFESKKIKYASVKEVISIIVRKSDGRKVLSVLHDEFCLSDLNK